MIAGRRVLKVLATLVAVLLVAGVVAHRLWQSDRAHSVWCRVAYCPDLLALDRLCSRFAEAEMVAPVQGQAPITYVRTSLAEDARALAALDEVMTATTAARYPLLLEMARDRGGVAWSCPAMKRTLGWGVLPHSHLNRSHRSCSV